MAACSIRRTGQTCRILLQAFRRNDLIDQGASCDKYLLQNENDDLDRCLALFLLVCATGA